MPPRDGEPHPPAPDGGAVPGQQDTRRPPRLFLAVVLAAAVASGFVTIAHRFEFVLAWRSAPREGRDGILFGQAGPTIEKVRSAVPESGSLLLVTSLDPALLPYYLFPRRIFQCGTEPETDRFYMEQSPSPYLWRPPASFPVDATLVWNNATREQGGVLYPGSARP